jgi:4-hydroxybenzoate polyprenyltransferase
MVFMSLASALWISIDLSQLVLWLLLFWPVVSRMVMSYGFYHSDLWDNQLCMVADQT